MKKYDCLLIDVVNLCYKTFQKNADNLIQIGPKFVYKDSVCSFINSVEELVQDYLHFDGEVYLLFDNYFSRADLKSAFMYADRKQLDEAYKSTRKKEKREFYNSINFLKYYYLLESNKFRTVQVTGLEADDLVKPLLDGRCRGKTCLLITSDLDWCRYLKSNTDWLPSFKDKPETCDDLSLKLNFKVSEKSIILYKAIFGDTADNIEKIVSNNETTFQEFLDLLNRTEYLDDIILLSRDLEARSNSILKAVSENEKRFVINVQLVSPIPCTSESLEQGLTIGRQATTLYKTVREAIGLEEGSKQFVFGPVKRGSV